MRELLITARLLEAPVCASEAVLEQETPDGPQPEGFSAAYFPQSAMKARYKTERK